jgi:hypothetical protein
LATLRQKQGKCAEACNFVAPMLERITEGFGTLDLIEAQNLLQSLSSSRD